MYQFLFQQCLDSQEFDKNQNYQDRIFSQSAVRITGFPLEIIPIAALCFRPTLVILEYFIKLASNNKSTVFHDDS